jgi:osmotically inducible protein OsmC
MHEVEPYRRASNRGGRLHTSDNQITSQTQEKRTMAVRTANAVWEGDLPNGKGTMKFGNGAFEGQYSFASRFEEGTGTNPEELIAAAHAGCFSMAFSNALSKAGFVPTRVQTEARVRLEKVEGGFGITSIELNNESVVPGIDEAQFQEIAEGAKKGCPVSRALAAVDIQLNAKLVGSMVESES